MNHGIPMWLIALGVIVISWIMTLLKEELPKSGTCTCDPDNPQCHH